MNLQDLEPRDCRHTILYGDGGTGKTTLAGALAEKFKLTWLSLDSGHAVLKKLPREWQANIEIIVLPDTVDRAIAGVTVKELFNYKPVRICYAHGEMNCNSCLIKSKGFDTVDLSTFGQDRILVIDHISRISDSIMAHVTRKQRERLLAQDPLSYYKPQLDDYGSLSFNIGDLIKKIEVSPINILCLAQSQEQPTEVVGGKGTQLCPKVGSSEYGRNVANHFDNQIFASVEMMKHKFGSMSTYSIYCKTKSRDDIAIEKMEVPSLIPFYDIAQHKLPTAELNQAVNGATNVKESLKPLQATDNPTIINAGDGSTTHVVEQQLSPSEMAKKRLAEIMAGKK